MVEPHLDAAHEPARPAPDDGGDALDGLTLAGHDGVDVEDRAPLASNAPHDGRSVDEHLLLLPGVSTAHGVRDHHDGGDEHLPLHAVRLSRSGIVVQAGHALLCLRHSGHGHGDDHDLVGGNDGRESPLLQHRSGAFASHAFDVEESCGRVPEPHPLLRWRPVLPPTGLDIVNISLSREVVKIRVEMYALVDPHQISLTAHARPSCF